MDELAERFEENRPRLRAVAYRMLGSPAEADDAVQEAWLRLSRAGGEVDNLAAWLTTVVGRVCLDQLRSRAARREQTYAAEPPSAGAGPEQQAELADAVGVALLVVLETLTPSERLAFVLHDLFAVSFEEIAPIVDRTPDAARQLASRARRRVRGAQPAESADRAVVEAFLTASRGGELTTLLTLLDPDVQLRVDRVTERSGADAVARFFAGRARTARPALIDGTAGIAVMNGNQVRIAMRLQIHDGRITVFDALTDPEKIQELTVVYP